ncbi:MAG: HDOD domain-containing protein [Sulfuriferula sp.]|nr:HDOD domain-containing protein [Sulfuriferula sp.]
MVVKFGMTDGDSVAVRRKQLLQKIQEDPALPALGVAVSQVVQIASSTNEAVHSLANFILSDVALTQKVLSMANTVGYRTASGAPVTTISKAIFLLGFDAVRTIALTMLLVEGMTGKSARSVRMELVQSLGASLVGRELARRSTFKDAEEASVVGLFKNFGRLLVVMHDEASYDEIMALSATGATSPTQAAMQVLGCGFDSLAESVLRQWQIPLTIVKALAPLPAGVVKVAATRQEWLQQAAAFSADAVILLSQVGKVDTGLMMRNLLARYGVAFDLDNAALSELLARVAEETQTLTNTICPLMLPAAAPEPEIAELSADAVLDEFLLKTADSQMLQNDLRHPSGKPVNARDLLLAGVQDATEMVASGRCKVNDLIMLVLETLYHGMGFRFATACIKDVKAQQFRARISLGEDHQRRQDGFAFPVAASRDVFHLAMQNDVDVLIADAAVPNVRALLPDWHTRLLPDAKSFIVLPLVVQKQPFGLLYADRACVAAEGVPPDEAALIKTLKAQIMTVLMPR